MVKGASGRRWPLGETQRLRPSYPCEGPEEERSRAREQRVLRPKENHPVSQGSVQGKRSWHQVRGWWIWLLRIPMAAIKQTVKERT